MAKIRDIAGKLGLSPSTVSKALNGYAGVSAETRKMILREAERQHYVVLPLSVRRERAIREEIGESGFLRQEVEDEILPDPSGEKESDRLYETAFRETAELIRMGFRQISYETSRESVARGVEKACMAGNVIAERMDADPVSQTSLGMIHAYSASDQRSLIRIIENPANQGWDWPGETEGI